MRGLTFVEILVVIFIMGILMILAIPSYRLFQRESDLNNSTEEIINTLRVAQNKTLASERGNQWGVYFDTTLTPHQFTLFKGANFVSRDSSFDEIHKLPNSLEIFEINLAGGESQVVFERVSGNTPHSGNISFRLKNDITKTKSIYIENSGKVDILSPLAPSDQERVKDSRHTHFMYNQNAQTALILSLRFPDFPSDNFDINFQNFLNPQKTKFYWEGSVLVGPAGGKTSQSLIIQTHSLEIAFSQFSIHRDRRFNDKALEIWLDDQNLINFTAEGQTSKGSSIHVTDPEWQ